MELTFDASTLINAGIFALLCWHTKKVQYLCERVAVHDAILKTEKNSG